MSRRHFLFPCGSDSLAATLDPGDGSSGLLIVSGGNELRCGPFGSHAQLAERIAASGFAVMRFDRRGVGDSEGVNQGFGQSQDDLLAAVKAFRSHAPRVKRVVAYGNCDGASALMLARGAGCQALVLANPWTFDPPEEGAGSREADAAPSANPAVTRQHYVKRLFDPAAWKRLLGGKVEMAKLASSLAEAVRPASPQTALAQKMAKGLKDFQGPVTILLAENDRTAHAFRANWERSDTRLRTCPVASHSFIEPPARIWLQGQLLGALRQSD